MLNAMRIAAVVVTYNRKKLLSENVGMLLAQDRPPDAIIIVDNHSTDGSQEEILSRFAAHSDRINYNYLPRNTFGAGGFEYGTRLAYELGYDMIWLMDDDGRPADSATLSKLLEVVDTRKLTGTPFLLNSMVLCDEAHISFSIAGTRSRQQLESMAVDGLVVSTDFPLINPFNGTLASRELVAQIGFPNGRLVIYGDETDFACRAVDAHAFVATVTASLYYHPSHDSEVELFGKHFSIIKAGKWKYYYSVRNCIYRLKARGSYLACVKKAVSTVIGIICADDRKLTSLRYACRGAIDGFRGRLGLVVEPENDKTPKENRAAPEGAGQAQQK